MKCGMVFSRLSLPLRQCPALWDVELRFFTEYAVVETESTISGGRLQVTCVVLRMSLIPVWNWIVSSLYSCFFFFEQYSCCLNLNK